MMRIVLTLLLTAQMAIAQDLTTDAFGVLPTAQLGERTHWAGLRQTANGQDRLIDAGPSDAVILFVGPKSIVAGFEPGHAVALGLDVHGNMVSGVPAHFQLGFAHPRVANTANGIADVLFWPPPQSGNFLAGAEIGAVQSARADYRVTAHLATVQPQFLNETFSILPETFGQIATTSLSDTYGNMVDDGVGISFIFTDEEGATTFMPSLVRDGAARGILLARDLSGPITGSLALAGTGADGLSLVVDDLGIEDAGSFVVWSEPAINAVRVRVGPLATSAGFLVPDGTAGQIAVTAANGMHHAGQGWILDGYLSFVLPLSPDDGPFDVSLSMHGIQVHRIVALSPPPQNLNIRPTE